MQNPERSAQVPLCSSVTPRIQAISMIARSVLRGLDHKIVKGIDRPTRPGRLGFNPNGINLATATMCLSPRTSRRPTGGTYRWDVLKNPP